MLKKCINWCVVTMLCFVIFPTVEASTWSIELGKEAAANLTRDFTALELNGSFGSSTVKKELGEYTTLVFGRYNCYNTAATSRNANAVHDELGIQGTVFLMDIENSVSTIKEQQSNFDGVYLSTTGATSGSVYSTCYSEITRACTALGSGSGVLPAMVVLDSKGTPVYCSTNYSTSKAMYLTLMSGFSGTVPVTSVSIDVDTYGLKVGEFLVPTVTVSPENASNPIVRWSSSDESVALVSSSGMILGSKAGSATITATSVSGGKSASIRVTVSEDEIPLTGVTLERSAITLEVGDILSIAPIIQPTFIPSNATNTKYTWSLQNSSVLSVEGSEFHALKAGTAVITVKPTGSELTATCTVTVVDKATSDVGVTGISLNQSSLSLSVGKSSNLSPTISPSNATNQNVTWESSNTSVATVSSTGVVTAKSVGVAKITVTSVSNQKTSSATVTVSDSSVSGSKIPVTGISIEHTAITLEVGELITIIPTITPSNASDTSHVWHTQNVYVLESPSFNVFSAENPGITTITAESTDGGYTVVCTVTVVAKPSSDVAVTGISLNQSSLSLSVGNSSSLSATISPSNATNKNVTWTSSNTSVATVSSTGLVTAKSSGTAKITATSSSNQKTSSATVTVSDSNIPVKGISLENTAITLEVGEIITITPTFSPSNASNKGYTWRTSNTDVLDSVSFGVFEALKVGTATITAQSTDGQYTATCTVMVVESPVTGISLNKSNLSLNVGETSTLTATISPSDAANQRVSWSSSSSSIATVSSSGVVTGKSAGTATIIATSSDGSFKASCIVTVSSDNVENNDTSSYFTDVSSGQWFNKFVQDGVAKGYFSGYQDGTFRPYNNITKGEFYTMLCGFWNYAGLSSESYHWSSSFAETMLSLWWIEEIPTDLDKAITRAEVAEVVLRSTGAIPDFLTSNPYQDTQNLSAITLYDMGIMEGSLDGNGNRNLNPDNNISRAEFAAVLFSLEYYMDEVCGVTDFRFRRDAILAPENPAITVDYFQEVFSYMLNYSIMEFSFTLDDVSMFEWRELGYMDLLSEGFDKAKDVYAQMGCFISYIDVNSSGSPNGYNYTLRLSNTQYSNETLLDYQNRYLLQVGYWAQEEVDQGHVKPSDSDYDKAYYLYGYCAKNFAYDSNLNNISYTGYGLVKNGIGVCQAYVSVYNAMCSIYGIEIQGVSGIARGNHIWSYANLDGAWLYIDPTFGDPLPNNDIPNYQYFALTRSQIEETHTFEAYW